MPEPKEWYSLPIRDKKRRTKFLLLFALSVGIFWFAFGTFWGLFSLLVIGLVLLPFYTKTHYRIEEGKIYIKKPFYVLEKDLSYYKKVLKDRYGLFLSPFKKSIPLENFRGLFLQVDDESLRDELFEYLKGVIEGGDKGEN
jgi:hypothetical protein